MSSNIHVIKTVSDRASNAVQEVKNILQSELSNDSWFDIKCVYNGSGEVVYTNDGQFVDEFSDLLSINELIKTLGEDVQVRDTYLKQLLSPLKNRVYYNAIIKNAELEILKIELGTDFDITSNIINAYDFEKLGVTDISETDILNVEDDFFYIAISVHS